jgi:hypothetical protein
MRAISFPRKLAFLTLLLGFFGSVIPGMAGDGSVLSGSMIVFTRLYLAKSPPREEPCESHFVFIFRGSQSTFKG